MDFANSANIARYCAGLLTRAQAFESAAEGLLEQRGVVFGADDADIDGEAQIIDEPLLYARHARPNVEDGGEFPAAGDGIDGGPAACFAAIPDGDRHHEVGMKAGD